MSDRVHFWLDFGSNDSYLSALRIEDAAAWRGVAVRWRPFLPVPIFQSFGWSNSPFVLQKQKGDHVWKDMERQCIKYALPWRRPSVFPRAATWPMKVAAAHADAAWIGDYCRAFMTRNFALDENIAGEAMAQAQALSTFGAPTFFVRGAPGHLAPRRRLPVARAGRRLAAVRDRPRAHRPAPVRRHAGHRL